MQKVFKRLYKLALILLALCISIFAVSCAKSQPMKWYNGNTEPTATLGSDGDVYLNSATGNLYNKTDGEWNVLLNIKGEAGQNGQNGKDGVNGKDGINGKDGVGIVSASVENGELIIKLSDGSTINAGSLTQTVQPGNTEMEARQAFYAKMKEKAASFGIDTAKLTFNSAISESSGSITSQDMAKLGVMAMGHDEIAKIWNQHKYTFTTTGVVKTFEVDSTIFGGDYGKYLTDYYYVLGGKTGSVAKTGAGTPVSCIVVAVEGPGDATFVGFISTKATDTDGANRYRTAKTAFDIASQKYLDPNADVSALEATLPSDSMITILSLPKTGNLLNYNHYDWYGENSKYLVYDKNGTSFYYTASSWKILTCMTALDFISDMDERLTITESCIKTGSGPAFVGGEQITYRDALHLILLPSSNTTCVALAQAIGQKIIDRGLNSSVSGNPVFGGAGGGFDFEHAQAVSVATAKQNPDVQTTLKVRGIVVGGTNNYDNGGAPMLIVKDETSNEICGVRGVLSKKNAYEVNMPFALGDIIEIPVVSEVVKGTYSYGGEANKLSFTWMGDKYDSENPAAFVAKYRVGHTDNYSIDKSAVTTVIDSQEALETFLGTAGYHWQVVILRGTADKPLKAVTGAATTAGKTDRDMTREYIRFYFNNATSLDEQKVGKTSPALSNFGNLHNLDSLLSTIMFNQTEYSQEDFSNPYTFVGDVYCLVMGGSTSYFHFVVLDSSCIVK